MARSGIFKSDGDIHEVLGKYLTDGEIENLPESEEDCKEIYHSLPWTKAIVVFIDLPELDELGAGGNQIISLQAAICQIDK